MGKVIVITSGKGGVGKTTTTANIGTGLAQKGKSVVLIDADIGLRNLDLVLGLENRVVYDLVDVVEGDCRVKQALIKDKRFENLYLLAAAQTKDKSAVSPEQMIKLCSQLVDEFDYIIIDCPAGIEQGFKNAIAGAHHAIVVVNPEMSSVRDADRIIGLLQTSDIENIQLVLNRLRPEMTKRDEMLGLEDVVDILAIDVLGVVPDDTEIIKTTNRGDTAVMVNSSRAGASYRNIVDRMLNPKVPMLEVKEEAGLMAKLKKIFSRG